MTNHTLSLKDGRILSYALYGTGDGQHVIYLHGTPSSRLEPLLLSSYNLDLDALLVKYSINLIAIDRPGMGHSTINLQGTFLSFADDVKQLLDQLNINTTKVLGWSGAGPFALALAFKFPALIQSAFILTGFTRSFGEAGVSKNMSGNRFYFGAAQKIPWLLRAVMNVVSKRETKRSIPKWLSGLPAVDNALMETPQQLKAISENTLKEACLNGSNGAVYEAAMYYREFGFRLEDIQQPVYFWWGSEDTTVTKIHAESVEKRVANNVMFYKPNEGHLSIYVNYFQEVFATIGQS